MAGEYNRIDKFFRPNADVDPSEDDGWLSQWEVRDTFCFNGETYEWHAMALGPDFKQAALTTRIHFIYHLTGRPIHQG